MTAALYDDGRVRLDDQGVTLSTYYFPSRASKLIRYAEIRAVTERANTWLTGKGRAWGSGDFRHWLPLDWQRHKRPTLMVLDLGAWVRPAFTPDDPQTVQRLLRERAPQAFTGAGR